MAVGGSRTLKLSILADIDNLKKNLTAGSTEVEGFGSKLGGFASKAGLAFAAAGAAAAAYAGKLLIDGVQSAIADEAAQAKLATTLKNVTGATNAQVAAVEAQILKTSLLTGKTDDELRPSFERLIRSTKSVEEAAKLQALALDVSAGSGKSLEAVTNALAKASEGQTAALGKLGVGISAADLKTMSLEEITAKLGETFKNQASIQADTFAGKMDRLKVAFDEGKETAGSFVLDAITPLISSFVDKGIPAISQFASGLGKSLGPAFGTITKFIRDDLLPILTTWWGFLYNDIIPAIVSVVGPILSGLKNAFDIIKKAIVSNSEELEPFLNAMKKVWEFIKTYLAPLLGGAFKIAIETIARVVGVLVTGFSNLVGFISDAFNLLNSFINLIKNNPIVKGISGVVSGIFGGGKAVGGPVQSGTSYIVGERGPELFTPNSGGMITPNNRLGGSGGNTININVTGAIDPEGTARSIINVLNNSFYRGTGGSTALVTS